MTEERSYVRDSSTRSGSVQRRPFRINLLFKLIGKKKHRQRKSQAISPSPLTMTANRTSPLTTHVLDTSLGRPAAEVPIKLYRTGERLGEEWSQVSSGQTNSDGRCNNLLNTLEAGVYKITFDTATYFNKNGIRQYFYPYVDIVFEVQDPNQHYHVPLLLNPFGYSTYRGS
ncbi:5-hydroxyisourate hydrolase-like isoform X3 [Branchiostoma floridae x Branchiostoma japonicum]